MKVVVQRVTKASVFVQEKEIGRIDKGLLVLVGIGGEDTENDIKKMAEKVTALRVFADEKGKMNLSVLDIKGEILVVPQFTLFADLKGQNRPYFGTAAKPEIAQPLFNQFMNELKRLGISKVATGQFGAYMQVELTNDGPVTLVIDSDSI